jgi:hypothetical protein
MTMYQLRHKEFGIFQGLCEAGVMWFPGSCLPELGIFRFKSKAEVEEFVKFLCSGIVSCCKSKEEIIVEDYDEELDTVMKCSVGNC